MLQAFSLSQICAPVPADLSLPGSKKAPGRVPPFALDHRLPQDSSSLAPLRPSPPTSRERQRAALSRGGGGSVPRRQCGTAKRPFPRTAPHAGHRLVLNPCRRAALRNYSLFTLLYSLSQPCSFFPPGRTEKQKYILFFGRLTHNSVRYNIGLNLIMEGKEYGKTGSA